MKQWKVLLSEPTVCQSMWMSSILGHAEYHLQKPLLNGIYGVESTLKKRFQCPTAPTLAAEKITINLLSFKKHVFSGQFYSLQILIPKKYRRTRVFFFSCEKKNTCPFSESELFTGQAELPWRAGFVQSYEPWDALDSQFAWQKWQGRHCERFACLQN